MGRGRARADPINVESARICSKHFTEADLDPSCISKKKLGFKCKLNLKEDAAIPSMNLPLRLVLLIEGTFVFKPCV